MNGLPSLQNDTTLAMSLAGEKCCKQDHLARLMDRYLISLEEGAPLDLEKLIADHPDLADEIRSAAASIELLHQTTEQLRPSPDSTGERSPTAKRRLGDFQIGRELGRGGMGIVYEARQISLQRQVALKVLPFAAMWDQKQVARFRNEAQAAAQLHHPNIVPVFAVGQERGVHFYAMQYVEGRSLDQVAQQLRCEAKQTQPARQPVGSGTTKLGRTTQVEGSASELSEQHTRDRQGYCRTIAELGRQAADALHHAHEYGVVHRDVKPSNLLLDDRGKLWITDFGLARVQSNPGVTLTGDVVGTLRYMSPEQAAGEQALVDARTDVYSLGVTLYELLTLQSAFPGDDRHAVLRDIEAKEPLAPRAIHPSIPVDLETIVLQAMSKSRDNRYSTAKQFADDLERFLEGKPTLARRPTLLDRTAKWTRRHRSLVATAALFLVVLTIGSLAAVMKISQEQQRTALALGQAEENLARAEQHFAHARGVVDRFGIQLADELQSVPGTEPLRQRLLVETLKYYQDFAEHIAEDAAAQDQLAMTHLRSGVVSSKLGALRRARTEYLEAQQLLQRLLVAEPENRQLSSQLALSRNNLALLLAAEGETANAREQFTLAIAEQQRLLADEPQNEQFTSQLAETLANFGTFLSQHGELQTATRALQEGIDVLEALLASQPASTGQTRSLAMAYNNLGHLERHADFDQAERSLRHAVRLLQQACEAEPSDLELQADLSLCLANLAALLGETKSFSEAITSYRQSIQLRESLLRQSPHVVQHRSELAAVLNNLALLQIEQDAWDDASESFARANTLFADLLRDYPQHTAFASGWAALLNNQGLALAGAGHVDDALPAYAEAVRVQRQVLDRLPDSAQARETLSRMHFNYAAALLLDGQVRDAAAQALERRTLWADDGERLFGVAVELAQLAAQASHSELSFLEEPILATLEMAFAAGYEPQIALAADERFAAWQRSSRFEKLLAANSRPSSNNQP